MRLTPRGRVLGATGRTVVAPLIPHSIGRFIPANAPEYFYDLGIKTHCKATAGITIGGTLRATGTTPPAVTISGTPNRLMGLYINIDGAGDETTATFRWSTDNGTTFTQSAQPVSGSPVLLSDTGVTATFAAGTYATDNVYQGTVSAYGDQSGQGNHLAQATAAAQPIYTLRHSSFRNGPVLQLDGSQFMSKSWTAVAQPVTYFVVCRATNVASRCIVDSISANFGIQTTSATNVQHFATNIVNVTVASVTNLVVSYVATFNGAASVFRRGATETVTDVGANTNDGIYLGQFHSGVNRFIGQVAEVAVWTQELPLYARDALTNYARENYGAD